MKCKVRGKIGEITLKTYINKALIKLNGTSYFLSCKNWALILNGLDGSKCVLKLLIFNILTNGDGVGPISPRRGLRQASYLFIICIEGLSTLLKKAEGRGDIHCIKVCIGAHVFSHLLFADDCFLFCRTTNREVESLQNILHIFKRSSGLTVNLTSQKKFPAKTPPRKTEKIFPSS